MSNNHSPSKPKKKLRLGFLFVTVLVLAVLLEAGLGLVFWMKDASGQLIHLDQTKDEPYVYYGYFDTPENGRNEDGLVFTGSIEKPANTYRVALIGGSVAEFLGREYDSEGNTLLQTMLRNQLNDPTIEVVPAGMAGYVVEQEFIHTQLRIQKYQPDLVVGLDGYNDMMSFKLNRYMDTEVLLPPQNYGQFQVITDGKRAQSFTSRFAPLFRNTWRAAYFVERAMTDQASSDFSTVTEATYEQYSDYYLQIIKDTRDFCNVKGISYVSLLQPVSFYNNEADGFRISDAEPPAMAMMYNSFEKKVLGLPNTASLTHIFDDNLDVYLDYCHVDRTGNELLAREMAEVLAPMILNDSNYIQHKQRTP